MRYVTPLLRQADGMLQEAWKKADAIVFDRDASQQQIGILKSKISKLAIETRKLAEYCEKKGL